jgi:thiosulfate reductase/polysulfide reductase chain A
MGSRRDFIKISGLGLGAIGLAGCSRNLGSRDDLFGALSEDTLTRVATYCEVCFWKCAGWGYKDKDGQLIKVIGNDDDPHCNGRFCPRGTGGIGMYYDKDRLTTPLIRVKNDNGEDTFREASWDEALELVASKFGEIKAQYGAETVALFKHGSSGGHFGHLLSAYGTKNQTAPSYAQCRGPREAGFKATIGEVMGSPEPTDIRDTECLVLIGSHLGENMHNGQVQEMAEAIDKDATIITVDPRFSTAASKSKYWLPIKPATDMALLLAWIHVLIYDELYDKDFIDNHATGFDELKAHVKKMTPEWAYGITTIKPEVIRRTAKEMANAAPSVIIHPGRHVTWYGDDTQRARAMAILNALLGSWGRRGGFYYPEKVKVPDFPHPDYPKPKWAWKDQLNGKYPFAGLSVANALIDASIEGNVDEEQRIRAWVVTGTNLPLTLPQKDTFQKAVDSVDFVVVCDTMPMEITGYADVILPECTYLERYDDLRTSPHREPFLALRSPVMEPLGDSKPAWWIAKELGNKMGLGDYFPFEDYKEVLDWQLQQVGSSLEEMEKIGVKRFSRKSSLYQADGTPFSFKTPSGKVELYSKTFKDKGFDPMPTFTAHPQPDSGFYRLIYGRAPMHTFSRTANNPNLHDLMDENNIWINPKVAKLWGFKNGMEIWLENQDGAYGSFPVKIRVTERIRFDSVYMVHGFGHDNKNLSKAFARGASDSELITNVMIDPLMGGTGMRGNFVTFHTENPNKTADI